MDNVKITRNNIYLLFIVVFLLISPALFCSEPPANIPLPGGSRELESGPNDFLNTKRVLTLYKTSLSSREVKDFFLFYMPKEGWRRQEAIVSLFPDKLGYEPLQFVKGNIEALIIINKAEQASGGSLFSVDLGERVGEPSYVKLDFVPEYPGADVLKTWDNLYTVLLGEQIKDAVSFYLENMPGYGWILDYDSGIKEHKMDLTKMPPEFRAKLNQLDKSSVAVKEGDLSCPDCPKEGTSQKPPAAGHRKSFSSRLETTLEQSVVITETVSYHNFKGKRVKLSFMQNYPFKLTSLTIKLYDK